MTTPNNFQRGYGGVGEWVCNPMMMAGNQPVYSTGYPFPMPVYLNSTHYSYLNNYQPTYQTSLAPPSRPQPQAISNPTPQKPSQPITVSAPQKHKSHREKTPQAKKTPVTIEISDDDEPVREGKPSLDRPLSAVTKNSSPV